MKIWGKVKKYNDFYANVRQHINSKKLRRGEHARVLMCNHIPKRRLTKISIWNPSNGGLRGKVTVKCECAVVSD